MLPKGEPVVVFVHEYDPSKAEKKAKKRRRKPHCTYCGIMRLARAAETALE